MRSRRMLNNSELVGVGKVLMGNFDPYMFVFFVEDYFWLYFIRLQCLNVIILFFKHKFSLRINQ
jgi:hypothetical protein